MYYACKANQFFHVWALMYSRQMLAIILHKSRAESVVYRIVCHLHKPPCTASLGAQNTCKEKQRNQRRRFNEKYYF